MDVSISLPGNEYSLCALNKPIHPQQSSNYRPDRNLVLRQASPISVAACHDRNNPFTIRYAMGQFARRFGVTASS